MVNSAAPHPQSTSPADPILTGEGQAVRTWSKRRRDRWLAVARILDKPGAWIRRYVDARTPRRGPRRKAE